MPLGDSTTAGSYGAGKDGVGGYRVELARLCAAAKLPVDFVGSLHDPAGADFDADHEGHRAWRIDNVAESVPGWLRSARPDAVLVQLGINDLIQGATTNEAVQRFSRLLDQCHTALPAAKFYVAAILSVREPNDYHVAPRAVAEFNARLPALVEEYAKRGMRTVFVDFPKQCGFQDSDFSPDGLHPSVQGYTKIAHTWFEAIRSELNPPLGHWLADEFDLPCFQYTDRLPFSAHTASGEKVKLPADPWFLLGNYRLTLFAHVSGEYELITGERAWGRLNQGDGPNTGASGAQLELLGDRPQLFSLTGIDSLAADPAKCQRVFGCGFARYEYQTDAWKCVRTLAVKPSDRPNEGESAMLLTVTVSNRTDHPQKFAYTEMVDAHYEMMQQQRQPADQRKIRYTNTVLTDATRHIIKADISGNTDDPLEFPTKNTISTFDGYPPSLFVLSPATGLPARLSSLRQGNRDTLSAHFEFTVEPGQQKSFELIIGYSFEESFDAIAAIGARLQAYPQVTPRTAAERSFLSQAAYGPAWRATLPRLDGESDPGLRDEMVWHSYNLEAMATYSAFYGETEIPQGTIYDYDWGLHASARDHFQHALPLCYSNPALARSVLKYTMKRMTPWGEIRLMESGYGVCANGAYLTSDQQLYYFQLLSEYLRITKDYAFLLEEVPWYPVQKMPSRNSLTTVEQCFRFLRDEIGVGSHGLVRLMNSDWNDSVFYIVKQPYNRVLYSGESHMNSAMAISILGTLISQLDAVAQQPAFAAHQRQLQTLTASMKLYRSNVLAAFCHDLGERLFPRRMYFAGETYGEDNMYLEPQGYTLQIPELDLTKKQALYAELKARLLTGEKLGAREQQTPQFEDEAFDKGSRENGGFWYSLNVPVVVGLASFDRPEAWRYLKKMTFAHYAETFPQYWTSYWSASDNIESSLIPFEGLPDQTWNYSDSPVYCAHPHAWLLYGYYFLKASEPPSQ